MTSRNLDLYLPEFDRIEKKYHWTYFKPRWREQKGYGLFAARNIAAGTCFPYFGKTLEAKNFVLLHQENERKGKKIPHRVAYVLEGTKNTYYDAYPPLDQYNLFLGAFLNEPSPKEKSNCIFLGVYKETYSLVLVIKDLKRHEELLISYGSRYKRNYKVGKKAEVPKQFPRSYCYLSEKERKKINKLFLLINKSVS